MSVESVVIIGGGIAGYSCARELRNRDFTGTITLVDPEGYPYDRPPLSKELLTGEFTADDALLAPASWYAEHDITVVTGMAERIDPANAVVILESGEEVAGDAVVIATGGHARTLPIPGGSDPGLMVLRTHADAEKLRAALTTGQRIAIIGAGLIGAEVASTAAKNGCDVTLIDPAPVPLVPAVGIEIAEVLHAMHADAGITTLTAMPGRIDREGEEWVIELEAADGAGAGNSPGGGDADTTPHPEHIRADAVLVAVGIDPYSHLAASAELDQEGGILVDAGGRTTHPQIWAIGDVARERHPDGSLARRHEHWESAANEGVAAAASILGQELPQFGSSWFWSDRHGVHVEGIGQMSAPGTTVVREKDGRPQMAFRLATDGTMVGAVAIDGGMAVRAARRIIDRGKIVDAEALRDPTIDLKKLAR